MIMDKVWPQTDSKEGMEILFEYARNAGLVLHEAATKEIYPHPLHAALPL